MSIATEITRLQNAKASIKTSIENKGVTVPSATKLDGYSALIDAIQTGGGGISVDDIAQNLEPSGAITLSDSVTSIGDYAFAGKPITSVYAPKVRSFSQNTFINSKITRITDADFPSFGEGNTTFINLILRLPTTCTKIQLKADRIALYNGSASLRYCAGLVTAEFPNAQKVVYGPSQQSMGNACFRDCTNLELADIGYVTTIAANAFYGDTKFATLIIRRTSGVSSLTNTNAFSNTCFASGKSGGTLYVPQALISSYQSATNWSTILGYANNQILPIEGSIYENAYSDGTPFE